MFFRRNRLIAFATVLLGSSAVLANNGLLVPAASTAKSVQASAATLEVVATVEDTDRPTVSYYGVHGGTGGWHYCKNCSVVTTNGSYAATSEIGDSLRLEFTGRQALIYGVRGPANGVVTLTIDGGNPYRVDTYSSSPGTSLMWTSPAVRPGPHTVVMTDSRQKNRKSAGHKIAFDLATIYS